MHLRWDTSKAITLETHLKRLPSTSLRIQTYMSCFGVSLGLNPTSATYTMSSSFVIASFSSSVKRGCLFFHTVDRCLLSSYSVPGPLETAVSQASLTEHMS